MRESVRARRYAAAWLILLLTAACGPRPVPPTPTTDPVPLPDPADVESVLFLIGDPGDALFDRSPILNLLAHEVEWWAERVDGDSAVAVLVLGDIVYPDGMRPPTAPEHDRDTAIVLSQVRVVSGPAALSRDAHMFFVAGNHDWGLSEHWEGYVRLRNLDEFLSTARERTGAAAYLVPEAGTGGPFVVDWGTHLRLILLDTAWWLLSGDVLEKQSVLIGIDEAFRTAGNREIAIAAHHPFRSGGPHGGGFSVWELLGVRYVLHRSGAILQDLTSVPYRELETGLRDIFQRHEPPLLFIGGHEHSLQVVLGTEPTDPHVNLVSGSGSKLSEVGPEPGLVFARAAPGYMTLIVEKDGDMSVFVHALPREYLLCDESEFVPNPCVLEGVGAAEVVFSRTVTPGP